MKQVDLPAMSKGNVVIKQFEVKHQDDLYGMLHGRYVPGGTYTKLIINNRLVMSDTPAERRDHYQAVHMATGSCLINGLGIGMVLKNILLKPEVTDVTVIEINQDLIDLVGPHYKDPRVTIICADAYTWKPPKGKRYMMVWHDIWNDICTDNLPQMAKLHRKYGKRTDWQDSWSKTLCNYYKRRYRQ